MACGTPVLALSGGSVSEIVRDGISGYICDSVEQLASRAVRLDIIPSSVRRYAEERFSVRRMAEQYASVYEALRGADSRQDSVWRENKRTGVRSVTDDNLAA